MSATYFALLTTTGATLLANATNGAPVQLQNMEVGDGGAGGAYTPTGNETALKNVVATIAIESITFDQANPQTAIATATIPAATGGFNIVEVGLFTTGGELFAIASFPPTLKPDPTSGAGTDLTIVIRFTFSGQPNITVQVDSSTTYATQEWVREARNFFSVLSATMTAPPANPALGATYIVAGGGSGAWAGYDGNLAIWAGTDGWHFVNPVAGMHASDGSTTWRYEAGTGWAALTASTGHVGLVALADDATAQAGADAAKAVTPAALASVTATTGRAGLVALADDATALAGTDAAKAVTPEALSHVLNAALGKQYVNASEGVGPGRWYIVDTTGTSAAPIVLTLPANPTKGMNITFEDPCASWQSITWTLARNGQTIEGEAQDMIVNAADQQFSIYFNGADWRLF